MGGRWLLRVRVTEPANSQKSHEQAANTHKKKKKVEKNIHCLCYSVWISVWMGLHLSKAVRIFLFKAFKIIPEMLQLLNIYWSFSYLWIHNMLTYIGSSDPKKALKMMVRASQVGGQLQNSDLQDAWDGWNLELGHRCNKRSGRKKADGVEGSWNQPSLHSQHAA